MTIWDFAHEHWFSIGLFLFSSLFLTLAFAEGWHARNAVARIAEAAARKGKTDE